MTSQARREGWSGLFLAAFTNSRNAMLLVDEHRHVVDLNGAAIKLLGHERDALVGRPVHGLILEGPLVTNEEWRAALAAGRFNGETVITRPDGVHVTVQWGASTETVTGRRLVLFVVLGTSRWGRNFRRQVDWEEPDIQLSRREREIVGLVAAGATAREIADELHIAHDTVRTHVRNAMEKLHARSRAHLVAKAVAGGTVLI